MPKRTAEEKHVQAGYIRVLPPIQKTENKQKAGRKDSTQGDTPAVARDKLTENPQKKHSKPTATRGEKISEPKSPNPQPNPKLKAAKEKKMSEPTPSSPQPNSKLTATGRKTSEPTPANSQPNSKLTATGTHASEPAPSSPQPKPKLAAIGRKTSEPVPSSPQPSQKLMAAKVGKTSELASPRMRALSHEGVNREKKKVSGPSLEAGSKLAGTHTAPPFLSSHIVNSSGKELHERPRSSTDISCLASPPPDQPYVSDKLQVEQDMNQFVRSGDAVSLSSIANSGNIQLPQLFMAENNYEGPPVLNKGQVIMVVKMKTIASIRGRYSNGKEVTLSATSSPKLSPLSEGTKVSQSLTAKALMSHKTIPPVVAVAKQFTLCAENIVTAGTILLLQREQRASTNKRSQEPALLARDLGGKAFLITAKCTGTFSTHPRDTALMLQEVIKHCQLPLKACVYESKEELTLESVTHQQVLVAYPFNAKQSSESTVFELPVDSNLQLVRVVMQSKEMNTQPCDSEEDNYEIIADLFESKQPQQTTPTEKELPPTPKQGDIVMRSLSQDQYSPKGNPLGSPPPSGASAIGTADEYNAKKAAENIAYLRSLKVDEVLELLEAMQLEVYKEIFKREKIDGEVLSSLTEDDLLQELNIQKRLHRVRLVKVIEGIHSVQEAFGELYI